MEKVQNQGENGVGEVPLSKYWHITTEEKYHHCGGGGGSHIIDPWRPPWTVFMGANAKPRDNKCVWECGGILSQADICILPSLNLQMKLV